MSGMFGGGDPTKGARREARVREQDANEQEMRARQRAERAGTGGRGRDMLVGRLNKVLPTKLGGV